MGPVAVPLWGGHWFTKGTTKLEGFKNVDRVAIKNDHTKQNAWGG